MIVSSNIPRVLFASPSVLPCLNLRKVFIWCSSERFAGTTMAIRTPYGPKVNCQWGITTETTGKFGFF
ncbi:protein of unknown function [Agrobacterium pusense]|uniref:Uncharacterized protein n=1 Tax=Agrobacterium pusense TaxID=648995 RepID=U4PUC5_9HYPH|nr:protein of unknown function [Agrobacterium pusense]